MAGRKVLVPFDFSPQDEKALHYVIRNFAGQSWAHVTLFHVYTPLPELDGYKNPSVGRLKSTMASMWTELRVREQDLKKIIEDLKDSGFSADQLDYVFKPRIKGIGDEIVQMCREGGYDNVVLSRKPGKIKRSLTRSIHDTLLSNLTNTEIVIII